jgi:hypothetical protein
MRSFVDKYFVQFHVCFFACFCSFARDCRCRARKDLRNPPLVTNNNIHCRQLPVNIVVGKPFDNTIERRETARDGEKAQDDTKKQRTNNETKD